MAIARRIAAALLLAGATFAAAGEAPLLATRVDGRLRLERVEASGPVALTAGEEHRAPLGSLWKLFVFAYLAAEGADPPDFRCRGGDAEEVYCCEPGGRIGRDAALLRSCGRYFEPSRLGIDADTWQRFWTRHGAPAWLARLKELREDRWLPVDEILAALEALPGQSRLAAETVLPGVLTSERAAGLIEAYGGRLRAKTWTMPDPQRQGERIGGAAGWFADGQAFWLGGRGAGIEVLRRAAVGLAPRLDALLVADDAQCVEVRYFARHALAALHRLPERGPVAEGPLDGRFEAHFENGVRLEFAARGELRLVREAGRPVVRGRLGVNDYVARVIDREAAAEPVEAARALAIAARSYLFEHALAARGCLAIDDSSATQRVAPRPPAPAARAVADWTSGLRLAGAPVRYHLERRESGVLAWREAVARAHEGWSFTQILAQAFPEAQLAAIAGSDCRTAPQAARWLAERVPRWRALLQREAGYEEPEPLPGVCLSASPRPYAERLQRRLQVRGWTREEDRIALAHEYLHLAFEGHPLSLDEQRVELLARRLVMEIPQ